MPAKKFPTPSYWILFKYERRWLGMMTKMKKMNVLIYQVTRFARDKNTEWDRFCIAFLYWLLGYLKCIGQSWLLQQNLISKIVIRQFSNLWSAEKFAINFLQSCTALNNNFISCWYNNTCALTKYFSVITTFKKKLLLISK